MPKAPNLNENKVFQFKVTLLEIEPPIWRRVLIPRNFTLAQVHRIIQIAFGWTDSHLHEFITGKRGRYSAPEFEFDESGNEAKTCLGQLNLSTRSRLFYEYDFGDGWQHELRIEKTLSAEKGTRYPKILAGERCGPPDDCGGPWGYHDLLEAIRDPKHPEHEEKLEWAGSDFDSEYFSVDEANEALWNWFPSAHCNI
jgi:Plasmid pRiA4b ORF-3-like protein